MAGQWNEEWHSWWDAAWQPTPRWRSALRDREAQSFDWPAAAQQSWCQSPSSSCGRDCAHERRCPNAGHTHSSVEDAFTQTHSSAQDAATQLSWTVLPRRRICSEKRSRTPDPRRDIDDSYAGLSRPTPVDADRWDALPPCAHHVLRVLLASRPHPLGMCAMTTRCRSISSPSKPSRHARHRPITLSPSIRGCPLCRFPSAPNSSRLAPYCSSAFRSPATVDEGKLTPARHADRTGHEPFPKQAALVVPQA